MAVVLKGLNFERHMQTLMSLTKSWHAIFIRHDKQLWAYQVVGKHRKIFVENIHAVSKPHEEKRISQNVNYTRQ